MKTFTVIGIAVGFFLLSFGIDENLWFFSLMGTSIIILFGVLFLIMLTEKKHHISKDLLNELLGGENE